MRGGAPPKRKKKKRVFFSWRIAVANRGARSSLRVDLVQYPQHGTVGTGWPICTSAHHRGKADKRQERRQNAAEPTRDRDFRVTALARDEISSAEISDWTAPAWSMISRPGIQVEGRSNWHQFNENCPPQQHLPRSIQNGLSIGQETILQEQN